jgi:hypothetical protein
MGRTNLTHALERKYSTLWGDLKGKRQTITEIEGLFEQLPVLRHRASELEHLMGCAEALLRDENPAWQPKRVKPVRPRERAGPVPLGEITKSALSILRETGQEKTCRNLAIAVLDRHDVTEYDKGLLQRMTNSINTTLRAKKGDLVISNDDWPAKWSISVRR